MKAMKNILVTALVSLQLLAFAQNEFYNKGADVYVQTGALLHVQGDLTNDVISGSGTIQNDGIIEVKGDFENKTGAGFQVFTDNASTNRALKFIGSGTQSIKGAINTIGTASFYNLVIDKAVSSSVVEMQTNVAVEGSIVFGNSNTTFTYNPTVAGTTNNLKGLIKTYNSGGTEYLLHLDNPRLDAVKGYPSLVMNGGPSTGYILTKGSQYSSNGGLERKVTTANTDYVFPIGTTTRGFNAARLNFGVSGGSMPVGGGNIKAKFCNNTGYTGNIPYLYPQHPISGDMNATGADNDGYNRYFYNNPCNGNLPQWIILQNGVKDHGYWSFDEPTSDTSFKYAIEAFANTYTADGYPDLTGSYTDTWRLLKHSALYGDTVATAGPTGVNWGTEIESSVSMLDDLLKWSKGTVNGSVTGCYNGSGIPGGIYKGFSHFMMGKAKTGNALPVELINFKATPIDNKFIHLDWATAVEINNAGFWLQRSVDGATWTNITWVNGHDNSTVENNYSYPDYEVATGVVYYYRLKQVDHDGAFEYTNVVSALLHTEATIGVLGFVPNPATENAKLSITSVCEQTLSVDLFNVVGQKVLSSKHNILKGNNTIEFQLDKLAAGAYTGLVTAGAETFTQKLIITR